MTIRLAWQRGGEAWVEQTDGNHAVVRSSKAFAPGTPLRGAVEMKTATHLRLKVQECRKDQDGSFVIRGRWLDLSRPMREELLASVAPTGSLSEA